MASIAVSTLEDYLATVYEPDCEYIDGEILERNMGESDHAGLQTLLATWLMNRRRELGIHVFAEMRVQVSRRRFRVPDITVTTKKVRGRILTEPPLLCIEILSPEDRASRLEDKVDDYLKFGVSHIWVLEPRAKRAWSYLPGGKRESATVLTTLSGPRIELPVMELFRELEDEVEPES